MSDRPISHSPTGGTPSGGGNGHIDIPIVVLAALDAARTPVEAFLARLKRGSIWQDQAIRSSDGHVSIEAHLWRDGLRCAIRIGSAWYHHPASVLELWHVRLPATVLALRDVPGSALLADPLFSDERIRVRSLDWLNRSDPDMGVVLRLQMPSERMR